MGHTTRVVTTRLATPPGPGLTRGSAYGARDAVGCNGWGWDAAK